VPEDQSAEVGHSEEPSAGPDAVEGPSGSGDDGDPTLQFVRALGVERNAKRALAVSTAFAVALYVLFVVVPGETTQSPVLYLGLAFVVLVATTFLLTIVLTAVSAWRLSREL
jgi:hypothetical protein